MHAAVVIPATAVLTHPHRRVSLSSAQGERIRDDIDIKSNLFLVDLAVIQTRVVLEQKATIAL